MTPADDIASHAPTADVETDTGTPAYFLSGAGNDFLALVEPAHDPTSEQIRAWCSRGLSIGADGLFTLDRTNDGARMRYWNADGGSGDLCLNGSRCAAQLASQLGWGAGNALRLHTSAGILDAVRRSTTQVTLALPDIISVPEARSLDAANTTFEGWSITVGVPHFVLPWPGGLGKVPITSLGPALRGHPQLEPAGANVDFLHVRSSHAIDLRTYERGVEAETLACGTGAIAAVAVGIARGELTLPVEVRTSGGLDLEIDGDVQGGRLVSATLTGDARVVATCHLFRAAAAVPTPTTW